MIKYLTVDEVIEIHNVMIARYGGLPGLRDHNLLESAIEGPKACAFGQEMYPSIPEKAAIYLYNIIRNHPFNDANKRTGYTASIVFMQLNNFSMNFNQKDLENLAVSIAKKRKTKMMLLNFI